MSIGTFLGVVLEYFIDVQLIRDLQNENRALRLKLAEARKAPKVQPVQHVEILDRRQIEADELFKEF